MIMKVIDCADWHTCLLAIAIEGNHAMLPRISNMGHSDRPNTASPVMRALNRHAFSAACMKIGCHELKSINSNNSNDDDRMVAGEHSSKKQQKDQISLLLLNSYHCYATVAAIKMVCIPDVRHSGRVKTVLSLLQPDLQVFLLLLQ